MELHHLRADHLRQRQGASPSPLVSHPVWIGSPEVDQEAVYVHAETEQLGLVATEYGVGVTLCIIAS